MSKLILALDQGTTSTRSLVFGSPHQILAKSQIEFDQHFPASGHVEHDPADLWKTAKATLQDAIARCGHPVANIAAIGITNQRETTLIWNRETGEPVYRALVWQDRRTADACTVLKSTGMEETIVKKTGLLLDPYFSATKIAWIMWKGPVPLQKPVSWPSGRWIPS